MVTRQRNINKLFVEIIGALRGIGSDETIYKGLVAKLLSGGEHNSLVAHQ